MITDGTRSQIIPYWSEFTVSERQLLSDDSCSMFMMCRTNLSCEGPPSNKVLTCPEGQQHAGVSTMKKEIVRPPRNLLGNFLLHHLFSMQSSPIFLSSLSRFPPPAIIQPNRHIFVCHVSFTMLLYFLSFQNRVFAQDITCLLNILA